jgi:hypothetical protein
MRLGDRSFVVADPADPPAPVLPVGALVAGPVESLEGGQGGAPVAPLTQVAARLPPEQRACRPNPAGPHGLRPDLLAQILLLEGELRLAEPKTLRYRLWHVAARVVRHARRLIVRLQRTWPWAAVLAAAFTRLRALPLRC